MIFEMLTGFAGGMWSMVVNTVVSIWDSAFGMLYSVTNIFR